MSRRSVHFFNKLRLDMTQGYIVVAPCEDQTQYLVVINQEKPAC